MSLLDVQNFLTRIYTDENLRREFLSAPERIGKENNLTDKEIAELGEVLPAELNLFADSLFLKRLHEVEKLLPLTKNALAGDFENYFREFANQFLPESIKKHLEDAIRFAGFLHSKNLELIWAKDLAKFEQAKLEFYGLNKRVVFRILDYNVKEISRQGTKAQSEIRKKKTFAVWLRIGKREIVF